MSEATFRVTLGKEDFKFSAAHFTIFPSGQSEPLHGHNYRVTLELTGSKLDPDGLLVDFDRVKRAIRKLCARLDGRTLLPARSRDLRWRRTRQAVEIELAERSWRLPPREVVFLPLANTSIELLAHFLWDELAPELGSSQIEVLGVAVEETSGQRCLYEAPLPTGRRSRR